MSRHKTPVAIIMHIFRPNVWGAALVITLYTIIYMMFVQSAKEPTNGACVLLLYHLMYVHIYMQCTSKLPSLLTTELRASSYLIPIEISDWTKSNQKHTKNAVRTNNISPRCFMASSFLLDTIFSPFAAGKCLALAGGGPQRIGRRVWWWKDDDMMGTAAMVDPARAVWIIFCEAVCAIRDRRDDTAIKLELQMRKKSTINKTSI